MDTLDAPAISATNDYEAGSRHRKSATRSLVAVFIAIATFLAILIEAPALSVVWQGRTTYGFGVNPRTMVISNVQPSEEAAGVRNGMHALPNGDSAWRLQNPLRDSRITVSDGKHRITVTALQTPNPQADSVVVTLSYLITFTIIVLAGVLCYQRPGVMTVTFWLFALTNCDVGWIDLFYRQLPEAVARPTETFLTAFAGGWGTYPLVWFALRFPEDKLRSRAMRIADYVWSAISLAAFIWFLFFLPGGYSFWAYTVPQNAPDVAAIAAISWVYVRSTEAVRQRAIWAIASLVSLLVLTIVANVFNEASAGNSVFGDAITLIAVTCPFALFYSVIRHRLLDISFVVNRALVFSTLTAFIVGVVGLADYIIGKFLSQTRAALIVEAAVTIGVGYALQYVHRALEQLIERVVFAGRHAAETHVDRVIAGLAYAKTQRTVLHAMVDEPRVTLDLQSAGAFIVDDGVLKLAAHHGWHVAGTPAIELDDPLARLLLSERDVVDIAQSHWHAVIPGFAPGALQIAVPLLARNELLGIAFYGHHRNGSALDFEERAILHRLCQAAAVAYEAVELAQARQELATLRAMSPA